MLLRERSLCEHPVRYLRKSMKYSGLQRSVLALYRSCLREVRKKPKVLSTPFHVKDLMLRWIL